MWCWQVIDWCIFFHYCSICTLKSFMLLSCLCFSPSLSSTHYAPVKGQVIIALKQMRYDKCQAVVMSDVCLRPKVRLPAEQSLVFMFEWKKRPPSYNPQLLSSSGFKTESCALRHVMCNQWWDSDNRKLIRCSQVNPAKQAVMQGDMMHAWTEEIKRALLFILLTLFHYYNNYTEVTKKGCVINIILLLMLCRCTK